jgi:hypothetical protein
VVLLGGGGGGGGFFFVYRKTTQLCFLKIRVESLVWIGEILSVEVSRVVCVCERERRWGRGANHGAGLTIAEV